MRHSKKILVASIILLSLCISLPAQSEETDEETALEDKGLLAQYGDYLNMRLEDILARQENFWGKTTVPLPEGALGIEFTVNYKRADSRYDDDGHYSSVIVESISLDDPFGGSGDFFSIDFDAKGHAILYDFTLAYAISDPVDIYATFPFQTEEIWLDVDFGSGTATALGIRDKKSMYKFLESLGRPRPTSHYKSKAWETGDFHFGVLWNYFRNQYYSGQTRLRLLLPTGRLAEPNNALRYGFGPEIDAGMGSFAPGISHNTDLRPPEPVQWLLFSTRIDYQYFLKGKRRAPRFLSPDADYKQSIAELGLDTGYFPDLSGIDDFYFVTPKHNIDASGILSFDFPYVSFGAAYNYLWYAKPDVNTGSDRFNDFLDRFDSYKERYAHSISGLLSVNLIRLKAPVTIDFEARFPVGGKNYFRFQDDYKGEISVFLPF